MKAGIHPEYNETNFSCACGQSWTGYSTQGENIHVDICSACHPFFTGKQKLIDTAGRIEKFNRRYNRPNAAN